MPVWVFLVVAFLAFLFLVDSGVGELAAVGQQVPHGRPEVHLLQRFVLGLLDDEFLHHLLAQPELAVAGARQRGGARLEFGQHPLDL